VWVSYFFFIKDREEEIKTEEKKGRQKVGQKQKKKFEGVIV